MDWFLNNWHMIVLIAVLVVVGVTLIVKFFKQPRGEQLKKIRAWLLQAVIIAEKEYGGGTGRLKLSVVYDMFCKAFPALSKIVTFTQFADLVDKALEEMRDMLSNNKNIAAIVENKEN